MLLQPLPAVGVAVNCLWGHVAVAERVLLLCTWEQIFSPGIKLLQPLSVLLLLEINGAASLHGIQFRKCSRGSLCAAQHNTHQEQDTVNRYVLVFCTSQLFCVELFTNAICQAMHAQQHTCDMMHVQCATQHCFICATVRKLLRAKRWPHDVIAQKYR
jgi:hypothetical protein